MTNPTYTMSVSSRWPHRWALLLVALTFPLVWVGGLVTTTEAGMAVPDWPSTYGYNLFLYPWRTWLLGPWDLFIEHGHRLLAATVGLATIALCAAVWRCDERGWVRGLAVAAVIGVIAQGVLGGLRVVFDERVLAKWHACAGNAFLAITVALAATTTRAWRDLPVERVAGGDRLRRRALVTAMLAFAQIVLGAQLRHLSANVDMAFFRLALVFHLFIAAALVAHIAMLAWQRVAPSNARRFAQIRSWALVALVLAQVALGVGAWIVNYGWPPAWLGRPEWAESFTVVNAGMLQTHITTAHVAIGACIWATSVSLCLWSFRLTEGKWSSGGVRLAHTEVAA